MQLAYYRRLGGAGRVALAIAMSEDAREVSRAGIRSRHPNYTPRDVEMALRRIILGDALVLAAWPREELRAP